MDIPRILTVLSLSLSLACGGESEPESEPTEGAAPTEGAEADPVEDPTTSGVRPRDPSEIPTAPKPWEEMTQEEKGHFMDDEVLPYMKELFAEYDAEEFGNMSCGTCHGPDMQERNFEMPAPSLPALHASGTPEQREMVEEHPQMVRFMFNHVVPSMRTMIGEEEYDPETGEGFSCYFCHPHAEDGSGAE
ncbi:MAG: hypothetical protein GWO22_04055 [Actinobacteria bacterium]|nr:hypothetical protein [Actinomycetota bacterium]